MGGILGLVVLIADIWAILDILKGGKDTGKKILWIALVVILPIIGLILYILMGKKK